MHKITANNFKSLVDFEVDLAKFSCLIGLNGSGKSTVLQFIDFLAQQARGDVKGWLEERHWASKDIKSQFIRKGNIDFSVQLTNDSEEVATWEASFNPVQMQCTHERITVGNVRLEVRQKEVHVTEYWPRNSKKSTSLQISFKYQGSILSQLEESTLPDRLVEFKRYFENVKSLDLLSPEHLRRRTRESAGTLGLGGQRLAAFLYESGAEKQQHLLQRLKTVYPQLKDLHTKSLRSGWKQLEITEEYEGQASGLFPRMTTEARHINDGMLRLIAILAELQSDHRFLLFDEIENGINPELVEFVLDALVSESKQVLVTTHSPMILNYLDDDVARSGVLYLYKTPRGYTKAIPFFSIPSLAEKLTMMGPGEVFVDTNLMALSEEIQAVTEAP